MSDNGLRYKILNDFSAIMSLFEQADIEERGVNEISKSLDLLPSKASRMLQTLESDGWVEKDVRSGKYRIGARFLQLGLLYAMNHPLRRIILPHLEQIARDTGLLSTWGIFRNGRIVVIDSLRQKDAAPIHLLGSEVPLYSSSYGKVFLAYAPETERKELLGKMPFSRFTSKTIMNAEGMEEELRHVKEKGYALDEEETREGVTGVTIPLFDDAKSVVAAISIFGPSSQFSKDKKATVAYLIEKGLFISRQLGYEAKG